jgi:hypothetical protein
MEASRAVLPNLNVKDIVGAASLFSTRGSEGRGETRSSALVGGGSRMRGSWLRLQH